MFKNIRIKVFLLFLNRDGTQGLIFQRYIARKHFSRQATNGELSHAKFSNAEVVALRKICHETEKGEDEKIDVATKPSYIVGPSLPIYTKLINEACNDYPG